MTNPGENGEAVVLPTSVLPRKYTITLKPDLTNFTFDGSESVDVSVVEATSEIVLNAIDLQISSASLRQNGASTAADSITFDEGRQTATLGFPSAIATGDATLDISFTGILNDRLHGFYRSEYTNPEGEQSFLATTQFEATDARRAFPCWDEPAHKASFEVTLVVPEELAAISNTPVAEETRPEPGLKSLRFGETPVMSTYLLAFVVGDLVGIEEQANEQTTVGVWTTRGKEDQGKFALDTSVKLLSFFNDYFGIPYPLEKLDHIAIPDFAAGAMENWGAITYRETALLVDEANSSAGTRQRVAEVVAHEMAHMWFGDLVTMAWWDDLWLNESFASWMGSKAVDWLFPEWDMWTQFVNMDTNRALSLDGLEELPPHRAGGQGPCRGEPAFRRHQLFQGRIGPADAGAVPWSGDLPTGTARLHIGPPVRKCPDRGPVVGPGIGVGPAGHFHHGLVDQADGLPGGAGGVHPERRRPGTDAAPGEVRVRPAGGRVSAGTRDMAGAGGSFRRRVGRRLDGDGREAGEPAGNSAQRSRA